MKSSGCVYSAQLCHTTLFSFSGYVYDVRDVTQGEDASRIRTAGVVQCWAIARNFALNLYGDQSFQNMAQAQS